MTTGKKDQVGVITEQGFVMGDNLGFKPIKENLTEKKAKKEDDKKSDKKEKKTK